MGASEKWLSEADNNLKSGSIKSSVISSYLSMFHAARSVLFFEGFREKSHYCIARYLEKHVKSGKLEARWIDILDHYREMRHTSQYETAFTAVAEEAEESFQAAAEFRKRMETLLKVLEAR